ncbi:uncharacterized protein LOC124113908 isoform X2 [Haliotis rufescens]|nr:uncharacterized protein LOC124113908 isoform X2 [Haliotis rufescens]
MINMLPKTPNSQFKTPYRAHTSPATVSPPATWSQCPDLLQATTPSFTIACSQMSTPGITVDVLQAIRKKPSGRRGRDREGISTNPDNGQLTKKQGIHKPIMYRQSMKQSKGNGFRVTSSPDGGGIGSHAETVLSGETNTHSGAAVAISYKGNTGQKTYGCHDSMGEFCESPVVPVQAIRENNKPGHREKLHTVRNSLPQAALSKRKQAAFTSKDVTVKRPKQVVKDTVRTKSILDKYFKTYLNCSKSGHSLSFVEKNKLEKSHGATDQIVLVNQDDYVYRDTDGEIRDVKNLTPASPEEASRTTCRARKKKRKEQVRLQVLKTIYKIETELAVLRHRRKQIQEKLKKDNRMNTFLG